MRKFVTTIFQNSRICSRCSARLDSKINFIISPLLEFTLFLSSSLSNSIFLILSLSMYRTHTHYLSLSVYITHSPILSFCIYHPVSVYLNIYHFLSIIRTLFLCISPCLCLSLYLSLSLYISYSLSLSISSSIFTCLSFVFFFSIYHTLYLSLYLSLPLYLSYPLSLFITVSFTLSANFFLTCTPYLNSSENKKTFRRKSFEWNKMPSGHRWDYRIDRFVPNHKVLLAKTTMVHFIYKNCKIMIGDY